MRIFILILVAAGVFAVSPARAFGEPAKPPASPDPQQSLVRSYETRADVARARENYGSAVDWYSAAVHVDKANPQLWNKLGIVQMKVGEYDAARKSFTAAIHRDPAYVDALNNLGAVYCLQRKYKPAVHYLKLALARNELEAAAHVNLAEAWMGQHHLDRAMTEYARALELDGDILNDADREGVFAQIATPEQRAIISFLIARAYAKRGNVEGALDYLQRAKAQNYRYLASVYTEPDFALLWKDPRLAAIVKP